MALAILNSKVSEKTARIHIKANKFEFGHQTAYVPLAAVDGIEEGESFEIPDGFKLVPWVDFETGETRKFKDGTDMHILAW